MNTTTTTPFDICTTQHCITLAESPLGVRYFACECGNAYDGNARQVTIDDTGQLVPVDDEEE